MWLSALLIKVFIFELLGGYNEQMGAKPNRQTLLACRMVASMLYHCVHEVMKKGMKIIPNNDVQLDEKPETRDTDQIDKALKL